MTFNLNPQLANEAEHRVPWLEQKLISENHSKVVGCMFIQIYVWGLGLYKSTGVHLVNRWNKYRYYQWVLWNIDDKTVAYQVALFCFPTFSYLRLGHQWNLVSNVQWQAIVCSASRRRKAAGRQLNPIICGGLILCICIVFVSLAKLPCVHTKPRGGHEGMQQIKDVIRSRLQAITYFVQFVFKYSNPKKQRTASGFPWIIYWSSHISRLWGCSLKNPRNHRSTWVVLLQLAGHWHANREGQKESDPRKKCLQPGPFFLIFSPH